jgi:hypothetical protein
MDEFQLPSTVELEKGKLRSLWPPLSPGNRSDLLKTGLANKTDVGGMETTSGLTTRRRKNTLFGSEEAVGLRCEGVAMIVAALPE